MMPSLPRKTWTGSYSSEARPECHSYENSSRISSANKPSAESTLWNASPSEPPFKAQFSPERSRTSGHGDGQHILGYVQSDRYSAGTSRHSPNRGDLRY